MKNIVKAFAVLAGAMSLAACVKTEYNTAPFVSLDVRTASVAESDPANTFFLPVHLYNCPNNCTVTYTVEPITATAGVDYELVDASGVLNFVGNDTKNIAINVLGQVGTFTGDLQFRVKLVSATDGVEFGAISSCVVSVKDLDHPLSAILGSYTANGTCVFGRNTQWPLKISADPENVHKVWIDYVVGFVNLNGVESWGDWSVYGIVSDDLKTISIPYLQQTDIEWADDEDWIQLCSWAVEGGAVVPDETPGVVNLVWSDKYGGFVNDGRIGYDALSGKMGNYYCLYYDANSILFKKN